MLRSLSISNYALIRDLKIGFSPGLTTITGETGAGKSILLGALSLILGQRADTAALLEKEKKCIVEGIFDSNGENLSRLLEENDLDAGEQVILRREISPTGKSRAFVNDTPVNLQTMSEVGLKLVDIHSQHQNLEINNNTFQLSVIDAFAGLAPDVQEYRRRFNDYRALQKEYNVLVSSEQQNKAEKDFLEFQFAELRDARLKEGEQDELEKELDVLTHAEEIKSSLYTVWQNLTGEEINVMNLLKGSEQQLSKLQSFHKPSEAILERLSSAIIELKDIASETESEAGKVDHDPGRLEFVQDRLDLIYKLEQKHGATELDELIRVRDDIDAKLGDLGSLESRLEDLKTKLGREEASVRKLAEDLSEKRQKVLPGISERITGLLVQLGIPNAVFKIGNTRLSDPSEYGTDHIEFLFTANRKADLQDISRIASGGELSRLMLSIKYIISHSIGLPTIIFDEIDTGVSGEIARRVAGIMREIAIDRQVFAITHLPQVASRGDQHYLVYKSDTEEGTATRMKLLDADGRENEIAKMLSGEQTTQAALANARELLSGD
ncbi:MAG TPA: DNA repair protein RecN [Bacteroidales bacterium]|nr:DNA repair protein RecN [Bacteroidales bacterium]